MLTVLKTPSWSTSTLKRSVWPAVHQIDERILPRGVEAGRLQDPAEHRVAERAQEPVFLERLRVEGRQRLIVVVCELPPGRPHLGRLCVALVEVHHRLAIGRGARVGVDARVSYDDSTMPRWHVD